MDKIIIFGRVYSFHSQKTNQDYYKIDYLTENGESCSDFIDQSSYFKIKSKNIDTGALVTARLELNQYNRGIVVDCISDQ